MVPADSRPQELTVPNLRIASGRNCVMSWFGSVGSAALVATGTRILSADRQATAP
jgi:hypothetical protein